MNEMSKVGFGLKDGDVIGAKKRRDGTWDTSRALRFHEKPEETVADPIKEAKRDKQTEGFQNEREMKEAELMLEIMYDGSVGAYASFPAEYSQVKSSGFSEALDKRWKDKAAPGRYPFARDVGGYFAFVDRDTMSEYDKAGVREFIGMVPAVKEIYEETSVPVQQKRFGGLLGSKTTMEKRSQKTGERPILHSEAVSNGKSEPLYKLRYSVRNNRSDHSDPVLQYKDDVGRSGNILDIEILLPQSTAEKVMQELRTNPTFARKIAGEVLTKKLGLPEKAWGKGDLTTTGSIRPPYENWDKKTGRKFYIKEAGDEGGFNQERIFAVK